MNVFWHRTAAAKCRGGIFVGMRIVCKFFKRLISNAYFARVMPLLAPKLSFPQSGKPTDNAFIESLNGKFRAECLNAHWFMNLADARRKCESWRVEYNNHRPHSAIGYEVPATLMMNSGPGSPP